MNTMIKKTTVFFVLATLMILLSGCEWLSGARKEAQQKIDDVVVSVSDQVSKTTESVKKKVDDINNAVEQVGEAVDAVKKIND